MTDTMDSRESFFLENFNIDHIFDAMERTDYLFLHYINYCARQDGPRGRAYLSELARIMKMDIPEVSKTVETLQNKGYVIWQTDLEAGKTYVQLSSKAVELMHEEFERMKAGYERIQQEIAPEDLEVTKRTMKKMSDILTAQAADG